MNEEDIIKKDNELRSDLESLMYEKLTPAEQEKIKTYIYFLKRQISDVEKYKRSSKYYEEQLKKEEEKNVIYKESLETLREKYKYVCDKQAKTEIELDIANTKILKLEEGIK